jgi:hypothetical protein
MLKSLGVSIAFFTFVHAAQADEMRVASIEAFLVYGQTGKLSPNIAPPKHEIDFWNTIIGEGGAKEWSDDILLIAHIDKLSGKASTGEIAIKVIDHKSKKVLINRKKLSIGFSETKAAAKALLLEDLSCTNMDITVTVDKKSKTINLPFACGE